jgi:hypothetical protein
MAKVLIFDGNQFNPETQAIRLADKHLPRQEAVILHKLLTDGKVSTKELTEKGIAESSKAVKTAMSNINRRLGLDSKRKRYFPSNQGVYYSVYSGRPREMDEIEHPPEFRVLPLPVQLLKEAHLLSRLEVRGGKLNSYRHKLETQERVRLALYGGDSSIIRIPFSHRCKGGENAFWFLSIGFQRDGNGQWRSVNLNHFNALKFQAKLIAKAKSIPKNRPYVRVGLEDSHVSAATENAHAATQFLVKPVDSVFETITVKFEDWSSRKPSTDNSSPIDFGRIRRIIIGHASDDPPMEGTLELMDIRFV